MQIKKLKLFLIFLFVISAPWTSSFSVYAQNGKTEKKGFNIEKVRSAVRRSNTTADTAKKTKLPVTPNVTAVILRMVISLIVILLLLGVVVYVFRRIVLHGKSHASKEGLIDVLETTTIMPGKSLSLVRASDRVLLLGISQEGIRSLSEFNGEKAIEIIKSTNKGNTQKPLSQFSENLNVFLDKFKNK